MSRAFDPIALDDNWSEGILTSDSLFSELLFLNHQRRCPSRGVLDIKHEMTLCQYFVLNHAKAHGSTLVCVCLQPQCEGMARAPVGHKVEAPHLNMVHGSPGRHN